MSILQTHIEKLRSELGEIEMKVTTGFTLADAIRKGEGTTTQKIGGFVDTESSCALGAAYIAARAVGYVPDAQ